MACGLLLWLAWQAGGYFAESYLLAGAIAYATVALLLFLRPPHYALSNPALTALAALGGLALWTGLSSRWSSAPDTALEDFNRALAYVGIFGLALLAAGSGRYSRHLTWASLGVITAIVGAGLFSRLYPDVLHTEILDAVSGYRLSYPLSYWNVFGALGAMGVVLALGLAADLRSPVVLRAAAAAVTVPLATAAYLSFSRGAWLAFFAGVALLLLLAPRRLSVLATLGVCGLCAAGAIGRVAASKPLTEHPLGGPFHTADGHAAGPVVLGLMIVAAVAQVVLSGRWMPSEVRAQLARSARPVAIAAAALALLGAAGFYVLHFSKVEGGAAERLLRAESWVDREWDEFMTPATPRTVTGSERLTSAQGTRSDLYRIAIDGFEEHPLRGDGSGGFEVRFAHERKVDEKVRDAHSLYLETLGELGLPGALLLITFIGALGWAAVRARMRRDLTAGQTAAASAAVAVWALHSAVDWDWQMPALTGTALLLAASLFPAGRRGRRRHSSAGGPATVGSVRARFTP